MPMSSLLRCALNMAYKVIAAETVEREFDEALSYIAIRYSSPQAMSSLLAAFNSAKESLKAHPAIFSIHEAASRATGREIRRVRINNYGLFYFIDEEQRTVNIISLLRSKRDIAWHIARDYAQFN